MSTLGKRLIKAVKEALAIARGEADPSTYRVHVPAEVNVKSIRRRLKLTQHEFSRRPGHAVGLGTGPPASRGTGADVAVGHCARTESGRTGTCPFDDFRPRDRLDGRSVACRADFGAIESGAVGRSSPIA